MESKKENSECNKTEADLQIYGANIIITGKRKWGMSNIRISEVQTPLYKINKPKGYIVQHVEYSQFL